MLHKDAEGNWVDEEDGMHHVVRLNDENKIDVEVGGLGVVWKNVHATLTYPPQEYPPGEDWFFKYPRMNTLDYGAPVPTDSTEDWVVMEKIHGANFQLIVHPGPGGVQFCRRNATLKEDEVFFKGWQDVMERQELGVKARKMYKCACGDDEGYTLHVFGELYGGHYPHPDVKAVKGVTSVQKEVAYTPELRFAAYDVALRNIETNELTWMAHHEVVTLCGMVEMEHVPILAVVPKPEAFRYKVEDLETVIPEALGLPPLPKNYAEGIVIKPLEWPIVEGKVVYSWYKHK